MKTVSDLADLRFLVVGLGSAGRRHAANLAKLGASEIAVCSESQRLECFEIEGVRAFMFHSYKEALAWHPDAVIIANPTALHAQYAAAALLGGAHVYVEKPLDRSTTQIGSLAETLRSSGQVLAVGNQLRFSPCLGRLKSLLDAGELGRIVHVHVEMGEYLPSYHPDEDYRNSYAARAELGGGVLLTQIHDINYLHWLFGRFDSAYAVGGKTSSLEIDVEDNVTFLLVSKTARAVTGHMNFILRPRRRTLIVAGERASAEWDFYRNTLELISEGPSREAVRGDLLDRNAMFVDAIENFVDCIRNGSQPRTGFEDAAADLSVVGAIKESMATSRTVAIPYDNIH